MTAAPMQCPKCGTTMNHQADKLVHARTADEAASMTSAIDGVIEAIFACPNCGRIESRRVVGVPGHADRR